MTENSPKLGPNESDAPTAAPKNAKVFGYNVAAEASKPSAPKPNPASPLAAG